MRCPECGLRELMGKGYLASGMCRDCYDMRMVAKDVRSSPTGDGPRGPVPVGEVCPTCGRKMPMTNAERQRRYRERKR